MSDVLKYYQALELNPNAKEEDIKQNYRNLAKIWHPDHSKKPNAIERFQLISVAYDTLSDDKQRLVYDVFCTAYKKEPAPDIKLLKIYKDKKGKDNKSLRVLSIYKKGKLSQVIASQSEAKTEVLKSLLNPKNYTSTLFDKEANLQLLLHNSIAYELSGNKQMAATYGNQALSFANKEEKETILKWLKDLNTTPLSTQNWNYKSFGLYKLIPVIILIIFAIISTSKNYISSKELWKFFEKKKEITYYQTLELSSGKVAVDDMDLSRIINYPVNIYDNTMLYHLTSNINIKFGPSDDFDNLTQGIRGQTVRVTGMSPDEIWLRIMLDDGQMGFVKRNVVKKGVKNPIPTSSKIK